MTSPIFAEIMCKCWLGLTLGPLTEPLTAEQTTERITDLTVTVSRRQSKGDGAFAIVALELWSDLPEPLTQEVHLSRRSLSEPQVLFTHCYSS